LKNVLHESSLASNFPAKYV